MTCEISILNRNAIALAADSALTVSRWVNGKEEVRYHKSANKIFQISNFQPVGVMIYGSGDIQNCPWEIIIKKYRDFIGDKFFASLGEYAASFFSYIKNDLDVFSSSFKEKQFLQDSCRAAVTYLVRDAIQDPSIQSATNDTDKSNAYRSHLDGVIANINSANCLSGIDQIVIDSIYRDKNDAVTNSLDSELSNMDLSGVVDSAQLAELAIRGVAKLCLYMSHTGIVFAGFGDGDNFPGVVEYQCHGNILDNIAFRQNSNCQVSLEQNSFIKPFATSNMITTFLYGINESLYARACDTFVNSMGDIVREVGAESYPNIKGILDGYKSNFKDKILDLTRKDHLWPLMNVVSTLPIDEMASLAETLVMLESIKEKVTQPTETVGGPVDVAVISKGDGFVWIKRKHYFDPTINSRYFALKGLTYRNI